MLLELGVEINSLLPVEDICSKGAQTLKKFFNV